MSVVTLGVEHLRRGHMRTRWCWDLEDIQEMSGLKLPRNTCLHDLYSLLMAFVEMTFVEMAFLEMAFVEIPCV